MSLELRLLAVAEGQTDTSADLRLSWSAEDGPKPSQLILDRGRPFNEEPLTLASWVGLRLLPYLLKTVPSFPVLTRAHLASNIGHSKLSTKVCISQLPASSPAIRVRQMWGVWMVGCGLAEAQIRPGLQDVLRLPGTGARARGGHPETLRCLVAGGSARMRRPLPPSCRRQPSR
jgi:hypothetical protein